ncbi:HAAS signaling domain-containing protein [Streptomyces sp. NPDC003691]
MKTAADPVRDYLSAVEREASSLPADRRRELLADLGEHIEVTRAERPGVAVREILAELGDPRTIAATALSEAGVDGGGEPVRKGQKGRKGRVHPVVPLLMVTLSVPYIMLFPELPGPLFGVLFRFIGAVLLCTSVHWTAVQKTTGVLLTAVLPSAVFATANLSGGGPAAGVPALLANLVVVALLAGVAAWLWRVRRV